MARACVAGLAATFLSASALAAPSTKIGTAPLISPSAADTYFGGATTATNGTGAAGRAKEIVELARALKGDPDLIYEHVRNNMATSWTYGLSKGAVGVIVDRSGTAFDQAQLMVELLREAGYTADYKLGTITLTGGQFEAWSGITSAKAACQLLSSGGIPAIINGSTTADCSYGAATVSTVTLSHAWVSVVIGGVSYVYDPAYKDHTFKAGVDLATATGLSAGMAMGQTATSSTMSGVPALTSYNAAGLNTALATAATALETYIDTNVASGGLVDVVGGKSINAQAIPSGGLRQVSLPYTANVMRTITGALPDQYRAKLTISVAKARPSAGPDTIISNKVVYGDEVYGRRLTFEPDFNTSGVSFTASLKLTGDLGETLTLASFSNSDNPTFSRGAITLALNLPYAANSGGYMDAAVVRNVGYALPFTIVTGFGDIGRGLIDKWGQRRDTAMPSPPDVTCTVCQVTYKAWKGDGRREALAAAWLAQAARAGQLHAAIGKSVFAQHYALGVSAADTVVHQTQNGSYWITDSFDRLDVETGFSLTSVTADATVRRGAVLAAVGTIAALKGSVAAQVSDLPDVGSVASRFAWGNTPPAAEDPYAPGARAFLEYSNTTQAGQAFALSRTEGFDTAPTTGIDYPERAVIGPAETAARRQAVADAVSAYVADGFTVVASREGFLGPGQRAGGFIPEADGKFSHGQSPQRGGALVAVKYDAGGDPIEVADILINPGGYADAGGGGAQVYHQAQYDPATSADVVKGRLAAGSTGSVVVASPATTSVGRQGAFPFGLSANLIWRGGELRDQTFESGAHREPQTGWLTPFTNTLTISSSGLEAMGETDVRAATGTIAAFFAAQDAYRSSPSLKREVAGQVIAAWWLGTLAQNVATVAVGTETRQWVRKPGGAWLTPGAATYGVLAQTGSAVTSAWHPQNSPTCPGLSTFYAQTRGYWMRDVSFKVTNGSGDEQTFGHWVNPVSESGSPPKCGEQHGFRLTTWAWPGGASLTFAYERVGGDSSKIEALATVSNNLGLWVNFTNGGLGGLSVKKGLYGSTMMPVAIAQAGAQFSHTDAGGAVTKFDIVTLGSGDLAQSRIERVYAADDAAAPVTQYIYDALGRVAQIKDRLVLAGSRAPTQYFLADGLRSEILNAAGYSSIVYADPQGRPLRSIDGLGAVSTVVYDGRGRPTLTTSPDGDRTALEYNGRNLVTKTTQLARAGSAEAGQTLVTEASWHATYNQPVWTKDARGAQTDYTISGGVVTKVELPAATTGATRLEANKYFYGSGLPMSWVSPTGFTRSATYAEGGVWDTLTNVISYGTMQGDEPDVSGNPGRLRRPRGGMQKVVYDAVRRPTLVTEPQATPGTYCSHLYNPGHCQSTPDPVHWDWSLPAGASRAARRLTYDSVGRVTKVERGVYVDTTFTPLETYTSEYDLVGNRVKQIGPASVIQTSYDALNRPVCTAIRMNPAVYDALPADACQPSAPGRLGPDRISRANYDAAGRVVSQEIGVGSPLQQVTARYGFSPGGHRISLTDANGNTSGFEYDGFGRLKRLKYPAAPRGSGQISATDYEEYGYDANGNRTSWRKRSGTTIAYTFDALNRATTIDLPGTADDVYYTYVDADRKIEGRVGSATATSFTYQKLDEAGRLVEDTLVNPHPYATSVAALMTYDIEGNRGGFTYDLANRLQTIQWRRNDYTPLLTILSATYDPLYRLARIDRENGVSTSYGYDAASRLTSLSHASADRLSEGSHQTFSYNPAGQLVGQQQVSDPYAWSGQPTTTLNSTHDHLNRDAAFAAAAGYDADGNLLSDGTRTFTYDALNRLRTVTGGPSTVTLAYDAWGRLASTAANGATTSFRYFGPALVEENDYNLPGADKRIRGYLLGPNDEPLLAMNAPFTHPEYWLHRDRRGSVIATSDLGGRMAPITYGPYGEPQSWSGPRFRYTGQMVIPEAQLYHYRARAYDPVLGRFLQTDPIGYGDGPNIYAYVKGDPVNGADPSGLSKEEGPVHCTDNCGPNYENPVTVGEVTVTDWRCYACGQTSVTTDVTLAPGVYSGSDSSVGEASGPPPADQGNEVDAVVVTRVRTTKVSDLKPSTLFAHFTAGSGETVCLTAEQFQQLLGAGTAGKTFAREGGGFNQLRSYYGTSLENSFGTATIILDANKQATGFHDYYNFDSGKGRGFAGEAKTLFGAMVGGTNFDVEYNNGDCKK